MKVAFVGIGAIGLPMCRRIAQGGYEVTGVDPFPAAREKAAADGLKAVETFSEAESPEVVVVMVATPAQLQVLVDSAATKVSGQTWVIMSTVGPDSVKVEGEKLLRAGAKVVDAPVTGGVARAITGELVIFASGDNADIEFVKPILARMGQVRIAGAGIGDGQGIKVVNQHLCSVHLAAAAEALNLAETLGLDKGFVLDMVKGGAAGSWMLSDRGPRMLMGTDAPVTSNVNIFVKDSGLVAEAAALSGAEIPLLKIANERFRAAADSGLGLRDDSRVIETYQKK